MDVDRSNGAAIRELLETAGLLDPGLSLRVSELAGGFPAVTERNMFLEYELGERLVPAGFGLGFLRGILDEYATTNHWFFATPAGGAVQKALSDDPFASDHADYLNLLSDSDPDWVEYDISGGQIDPTPFVFFRAPSRYRAIYSPEEVASLCRTLPGGSNDGQFPRLLDLLVGLGPVGIYRVGVARQRGADWWRAIITSLEEEQVIAALNSFGARDFTRHLEITRTMYAGRIDRNGASFALSVDVRQGRILAIDVECPYLFRIMNMPVRKQAFAGLAAQIAETGTISHQMADWLSEHCCKVVVSKDSSRRLVVTAHHLKCRFVGSPRLRTKAYLHLEFIL